MTSSQIKLAEWFATAAHAAVGQVRKHSGIPYICHPRDVVTLLKKSGTNVTRRMLAAAWLHDVVEDTNVTIAMIESQFDVAIARMVFGLTNERPAGMNRSQRHLHNSQRLERCGYDVKTIKIADGICNMRDIINDDPKFAPQYLSEKRRLLDEALVGGCPVLWAMADKIIKDYNAKNAYVADEEYA